MTILSLGKKDSKAIADVFSLSFSDGWTKEMLDSGFDGGLLCALGAYSDELVGVITYSIGLDAIDIEDVAVLPDRRREGIASALIKEVLVKANGRRVLLEVREGNAPAIALYAAQGFNKLSIRKKYYKDGEDAVVMIKE